MALYLISRELLVALCALIYYVSGAQQAFLSVPAQQVYVVVGKTLYLGCKINGTSFSASRVSWKYEGRWLHNDIRQQGTTVLLILRNVSRHQEGIYRCSVFNSSGLSPNDAVPTDANVTIYVGGPVSKPWCVSSELPSPNYKASLLWNAVVDYQGVKRPFTYNVLYCHGLSLQNKFCSKPPYGYSIFRDCPVNSQSSAGMDMECNLTSLYKRLFPIIFSNDGNVSSLKIFFVIGIANVHGDSFSSNKYCNPFLSAVKCSRLENIRLINSMVQTQLSLLWELPKDMVEYRMWLLYWIRVVRVTDGVSVLIKFIERGSFGTVRRDIRKDITDLQPYTWYHIYISCSINSNVVSNSQGQVVGPFLARTREEEPSSYPEILENFTTIQHGQYRDVALQWELPDNKTWNGKITRIVLHYGIANSSVPKTNTRRLVVLSNVSMTTGTLTKLRQDEIYSVTAEMCTSAGCGPTSQRIFIGRLDFPDVTHKSRIEEQGDLYVIIGVTFGLLLCLSSAVLLAILWIRRRRRRSRKLPLSDVLGKLDPPRLYESATVPPNNEDSGDYDEVISPLLSDKIEYVQIKPSPPGPITPTKSDHDAADVESSCEV